MNSFLFFLEITAAVNNLTSSSLIVHWPESSISNPVYIIQIRVLHSTTIYYHEDDWGKWWQIKQVRVVIIHYQACTQSDSLACEKGFSPVQIYNRLKLGKA